jgi:hypothetical protein
MATVKYKPNLIDVIADWQRVEADIVRFAKKEIPNAKNMLTKTMLQVIELKAQKRGLLQQMIIDSMKKETVNLSPDELGILSGHINRYLEAEGKKLCEAEGTTVQSRPFIARFLHFLLSYLMEDLKTCIFRAIPDSDSGPFRTALIDYNLIPRSPQGLCIVAARTRRGVRRPFRRYWKLQLLSSTCSYT